MPVIRVEKTNNYTVMSNYHLQEKGLSLKAKGLLSLMLSLPKEWDYTIQGLVSICKENETSIKSTLKELKDFNYLKIIKKMPNETGTGRIEYEYIIYEKPVNTNKKKKQEGKKQEVEILGVEILPLEKQPVENQGQLNIYNKINNNKINNINNKNKYPSLEEIKNYIKEKNLKVDGKQFYEYFKEGNWVDSKGNKVKNWKQKLLTWNKYQINVIVNKQTNYNNYEKREYEDINKFYKNN